MVGTIFGVNPGWSQDCTTSGQCAADSLVLISPTEAGFSARLSPPTMRFGALLQWAEPDDSIATCTTIVSDSTLGFEVNISGIYTDFVDRVLSFYTLDSGDVGSSGINRLLYRWSNTYVSRSGRVEGAFNISNSGGVLRLDRDDTWVQINDGLPQHLPYTNILRLAQSPSSPDHMLIHLGATSTPGNDPRGLYEKDSGGRWTRIAEDIFPDNELITKLTFAPDQDDVFALGSATNGLYLTTDGGMTYQQFTSNLDPDHPRIPAFFEVTAINWHDTGLFAALRTYGLFHTTNNGQTFSRLANLQIPFSVSNPDSQVFPFVNDIAIDPVDEDRILVAINNYAVYESVDAGQTWMPMFGDMFVPGESNWQHSALSAAIDPTDGEVVILGTSSKGIWRTVNGGANWSLVGAELAPDSLWTGRRVVDVIFDPLNSGQVFAFADQIGLLHSVDNGASWTMYGDQPSNLSAREMQLATDASGDLILSSYGGGIYTPGTLVNISDTIIKGISDPLYRNLDLGIALSFGTGSVDSGTTFRLICQDFQGYAIWRSSSSDPFDMELIGLYDKTNPETCIEGFCGDENYNITPNCFTERRAACFDFSIEDSVIFFDDNIYNGFTYYYSVSTFDYGNTAGVEPPSMARDLLFSPRFPSVVSAGLDPEITDDPGSPFWGMGNLRTFQINIDETPAADGEEIYCYPNPLRRGIGLPGKEGQQVVFTNLPPDSRILVFTTDGDRVADLGGDDQKESNIYWITRNDDGEQLASGIYIWKVEMPDRGDFYGKLVIIR
ncbi:MAG: hypothetical protein ABIF77_06065 [bacterium]